jgi:hypothetical protein
MQSHLAIVAVVLALTLSARPSELKSNISSITANIKIGKTIEVMRLDEPVFRNVICNFTITQKQSTPPSVILAGKVVDNNAGIAVEFVPIFFGSTLHHPRLAALTNVDGEFRFRVWLLDKRATQTNLDKRNEKLPFRSTTSAIRLQAIDISESTLYLEGKFDKDAEMLSSYTHIHSLREFLGRSAKQKP